MIIFDLELHSPEANLACDEALLASAEEGQTAPLLRLWESPTYFVVLGHANPVSTEINEESCRQNQIPILRRCSGGGTVLQGPGCLNYSLILPIDSAPELAGITGTNTYIMGRHRDLLSQLTGKTVEIQGHTDLAIDRLKFSGNAQRRKRSHLLFHGTFLLDFDTEKITTALLPPSRQPPYRENRSHTEFVTNLKLAPETLRQGLIESWNATGKFQGDATERIEGLVRTKYSTEAWNRKF